MLFNSDFLREEGESGVGVGADVVAEPVAGRLDDEGFGFGIEVSEAEVGTVAFRPFVVIHKSPWEVATDVGTIVHGAEHLIDMFAEVASFLLFALCSDAVFGNDHGFAVAAVDLEEDGVEAFGVDFPAVLRVVGGDFAMGASDEAEDRCVLGVVVVHADDIHGVRASIQVIEVLVLHHVIDSRGRVLD